MRVAINGFGRIGRAVFRIVAERADTPVEIVAVNDLTDDATLAHLLKYDTNMGIFNGEITLDGGFMHAGGQKVKMLEERDPAALPWSELGVDIVVESTGVFRTRDKLDLHLEAGASRILLTAPAKDPVDATIVLGVNDDDLDPSDTLVSNASCTTNCLAPVAKVLNDSFGIQRGLMTTTHAYTNDQRLLDMPHSDLRSRYPGEHHPVLHRCGQGDRIGHSGTRWEARRNGNACADT